MGTGNDKHGIQLPCGPAHRWSPDLGSNIGSVRWFAELALLICLIALSLMLWPRQTPRWQPQAAAETSSSVQAVSAPPRPGAAAGASYAETSTVTSQGETLQSLLVRSGAADDEARQADALVSAALFPDKLRSGTQVSVHFERSASPRTRQRIALVNLRPSLNLALMLARKPGGALKLESTAIPVETSTERIRGSVGGDLGDGLVRAGGSPATAQEYRRAIENRLGMTQNVRSDDVFDAVVVERRAADGLKETGEVLYAALFRADKPLAEMLRWGADGQFNSSEDIDRKQSGASIWPVNGKFTSGYGVRFHPILGYARMHAGIDISARSGAPIYAVTDGVVAFAGWHGGHGNYIRLDQANGQGTGYAHLSRFAVVAGERITSGQVIGYVGSTGLSTGPHLHYEVYRDGRNVDPLSARFTRADGGASRDDFQAAIAALKTLSPIVAAPQP